MSRISIYSVNGYYIGDIRASTRRSWIMASTGVVGQCEFKMSAWDGHATRKYLDFGRYVLVRENGLPDWIGVIYPPRAWEYGQVRVRAFQAERVLEWRITPEKKLTGSPGAIFQEILNLTNAAPDNDKSIQPNLIFSDGSTHEETLGDSALSHIQAVAERTGQEFEVTYSLDVNGRINLLGNWYEYMGEETYQAFREGHNMEAVPNLLLEEEDLYNEITALSDASSSAARRTYVAKDGASIAQYGLYQKSMLCTGVSQQATLETQALEELIKTKQPKKTFEVYALNIGNTYDYLRLGNYWTVNTSYVGFYGDSDLGAQETIRILGMEKDDEIDRVRIIGETQNDD